MLWITTVVNRLSYKAGLLHFLAPCPQPYYTALGPWPPAHNPNVLITSIVFFIIWNNFLIGSVLSLFIMSITNHQQS